MVYMYKRSKPLKRFPLDYNRFNKYTIVITYQTVNCNQYSTLTGNK